MRTALYALALGCFFSLAIGLVHGDDSKPAKKEDKAKKTEVVKAVQTTRVGQVTGKITAREDNSFTIEVGSDPNKKTYELLIAEDAKIRLPAQIEFDDKGKPKPFHKDPSDPNRNMPGVRGKKEDLQEGQNVIVTVGKLPNKKLVATVVLVLAEKK